MFAMREMPLRTLWLGQMCLVATLEVRFEREENDLITKGDGLEETCLISRKNFILVLTGCLFNRSKLKESSIRICVKVESVLNTSFLFSVVVC